MSTRRAGGHYDATMQLYVDGELLPREAAKISTFNHGLRYGDGVFERIRIYNRRIRRTRPPCDRRDGPSRPITNPSGRAPRLNQPALPSTELDTKSTLNPTAEGLPVFGGSSTDAFIAFTIGSPAAITSIGSFTGGDTRISSTIIAVTSPSREALGVELESTKKLPSLQLGIGAAQLG
jgi:hypothetical protein